MMLYLWRLSVTLCLNPVGGFICHSTSSFWSLLHAILLRALRMFYTQKKSQNPKSMTQKEIKTEEAREREKETLWEGAPELDMAL